MVASVFSGANVIWMGVKEALGERIEEATHPITSQFFRFWGGVGSGGECIDENVILSRDAIFSIFIPSAPTESSRLKTTSMGASSRSRVAFIFRSMCGAKLLTRPRVCRGD